VRRYALPLVLLLSLQVGCRAPDGDRAVDRVDLLIRGGIIVTMDPEKHVFERGVLAVRGERIVSVGFAADLEGRYRADREISAEGMIVLPGLVNAHNHAPMVLFRGIADDMALMDWLRSYIFPAEARNVDAEFVDTGTSLACLEMIRSGTTTFADMYYFEDIVAEATERSGMRAVLGETIIGFPAPDNKTPQEALEYTERFIRRWKGHSRIIPAVAPHAPYTNSAETLQAAWRLASRYDVPMTVHVAETRDEVEQIRERYHASSTQWLEQLGVLGRRVIFNHGVWLSDEDLAIVKRHGVGVTHNPESNMKLASGIAPVLRMLAMDIPVGLGTDGAASNNNLDMFEAMDFAAKLHKLAAMDSSALPAEQVVGMATLGGARALGIDREVGSLEPGKRADLILVRADAPHSLPMYHPYSHLVYALKGGDVRTSIIDGKVVMVDGRVLTLDENRIHARVEAIRTKILNSLK